MNIKYLRDSERVMHAGVELHRRRFYLDRFALDYIDYQAGEANMTPSEYVEHMVTVMLSLAPSPNKQ